MHMYEQEGEDKTLNIRGNQNKNVIAPISVTLVDRRVARVPGR